MGENLGPNSLNFWTNQFRGELFKIIPSFFRVNSNVVHKAILFAFKRQRVLLRLESILKGQGAVQMEMRVLFVHTNCFLQALCSHALTFNLGWLLSLQHLTAMWVQNHPPLLCSYLSFHSYSEHSCRIVHYLSPVREISPGHCGCDTHSVTAFQV